MLIDTHAHLCEDKLYPFAEDIVHNFTNDGLEAIICPGTNHITNTRTLELCSKFDKVFGALGVHPLYSDHWDKDLLTLIDQGLGNPKVVAVGEIGLDDHYHEIPLDKQIPVLLEQLNLAKIHNLPVIFHTRDAWDNFLDFLSANHDLVTSGVVHCFDGTIDHVRKVLDLGLNVSFTGSITFAKDYLRDVVRYVPLDRFMIETDSPYLVPKPVKNKVKINEPKYVCHVADCIAALRNMSVRKVIDISTANTYQLFKRMNNNE